MVTGLGKLVFLVVMVAGVQGLRATQEASEFGESKQIAVVDSQAYDEFDQLADAAQEVGPAPTKLRNEPAVPDSTYEQWKREFLDFVFVHYLALKKMLNNLL